jgi:hypothetical protein
MKGVLGEKSNDLVEGEFDIAESHILQHFPFRLVEVSQSQRQVALRLLLFSFDCATATTKRMKSGSKLKGSNTCQNS